MVSGRSAWQTPRATVRATHGARSRPDQGEKRLFELEDAIDQLSDRPVIRVVYPQFDQLVAQSHGKVGHASQVEALELIEHCVEMAQAIADVIAEVSAGAPPHSPQGSAGRTRYRACDSELLDKDLHTVPLAAPRWAVPSRLGERCDRRGTGRQGLSKSMPKSGPDESRRRRTRGCTMDPLSSCDYGGY